MLYGYVEPHGVVHLPEVKGVHEYTHRLTNHTEYEPEYDIA